MSAILALAGIMTTSSAAAAEASADAAMLFFVEPRDGKHDEFEAGYKRHLEWHRQNKDPWAWPAWQYLTGERAGHYLEGTFGHDWPELDRRVKPAEDAADHKINVDPWLARHVRHILVRKGDVSRGRPFEDATVAGFLQILTYDIRPGTEEDFAGMLAAMRQATEHSAWHRSYAWYAVVDGDSLPRFLLVIPVENFEALAPSEKTIPELLAGNGNRQERERHLAAYRDSVLAIRSDLLRFRADLSYAPDQP